MSLDVRPVAPHRLVPARMDCRQVALPWELAQRLDTLAAEFSVEVDDLIADALWAAWFAGDTLVHVENGRVVRAGGAG
jgi:hypothetical protein